MKTLYLVQIPNSVELVGFEEPTEAKKVSDFEPMPITVFVSAQEYIQHHGDTIRQRAIAKLSLDERRALGV